MNYGYMGLSEVEWNRRMYCISKDRGTRMQFTNRELYIPNGTGLHKLLCSLFGVCYKQTLQFARH